MKGKDLGIAIIGSGRIGTLRAIGAEAHPSVRFIACADIEEANAKKLAERVGAKVWSTNNFEIMSHPEVDAIIISTGEDEHMIPMMEAFSTGKPVLVEKPIGMDLGDAGEVLDEIRRTGVSVNFGYSRRFHRRYLTAKEQVDQGLLGTVIGGSARVFNLRAQALEAFKRTPKLTPVVYALTYYIDLMCWIQEGNPVVEIIAMANSGGILTGMGSEADDLTYTILRHKDGAVTNIGISYALPNGYPGRGLNTRIEFLGTEGVLILDGDHKEQILHTEKGIPHVYINDRPVETAFLGSSTPGDWALGDFWGPVADETRNWLDHLSTGRKCFLATPEDARRNLEISLGIEAAVERGAPVSLPLG
jgi:predicted dehydrogenase